MTTASDTQPISHTSDAEFRAWAQAVSDILDDAGLTVAGDTGQINLVTATRPGTNTAAGYQIRYLNDSLHGSKPCYIKIEFGTHSSNAAYPGLWITVASGTNGAGTVSGTTYFARQQMLSAAATVAGSYPLYACTTSGYFMMALFRRFQSGATSSMFFLLARTTDTAGVPTTTGFHFYSSSSLSLNRNTYVSSSINDVSRFCMIPGANTSTAVGGDVQLFRHFGMQPAVICCPFLLTYMDAEIGSESTFSVTPMGVTSRTYLTLGGAAGPTFCGADAAATDRIAVVWE